MLICPCQTIPQAIAYTHIAQFSRLAPLDQQKRLWSRAARVIEESLVADEGGEEEERKRRRRKPLWWSTSGLGVYWVHVRVDTRPKYYTWNEYKEMRQEEEW